MDDAIKLMGLGGLIRTAIKLIRGVQIKQDEENFTMAVFSVFSWFKVGPRQPCGCLVLQCCCLLFVTATLGEQR